jgi:signal transduction histidine kinase
MITKRSWTLSTRITALCVATALVLVLIGIVAAGIAVRNRSEVNRLVDRNTPLAASAQALLTALVNQETGIRGYAVNGRAADLEPYNQGVSDEAARESDMLKLLTDRPDLAAQVERVRTGAAAWRTDVAAPVIDAARGGDLEKAQALINDNARRRFDDLRGTVAGLQASIKQLRDESVRRVQDGGTQLVELLVIAALVVIMAGILLTVLLRYLVIAPFARLAGEAREVASGDYEHMVTVDGPPEVSRLAGDVEGMRRKIVSDLREVRAARQLIEETNQQLELQADELTRSNRDLEQFAYVASHDLQEPLRKVASFCQLLQRRYAGQLDERADTYIGFAVDGAQRMQRLINDLLAFSRIGRFTAGFTDVDLDAVVRELVSQREAALEAVDGEVTWSNLPVVRGEEPLLASLLGNLITNSIKFRRPGVPSRVELSARRVDGECEITCRDNGIGIDAEFADKVFVIFQRLHAKEVYPGTGIGLAIAKKIVEYHGGRIWLETTSSDGEQGTTIRFTLPVATEPAPADLEPPAEDAPGIDAEPAKESV